MKEKIRLTLKNRDIMKRIWFTLLILVVVRFGSQLPIPGTDRNYFMNWFANQNTNGALNFFSAFTGGSFERMSVLALNITPYITSSIIVELLTIAIPALEEMQRDGEDGRRKLTKITRYLTVGLSFFEGTAMAIGFGRSGLIPDMNALGVLCVIFSLTAGSSLVMWLGERITESGIGNGISIVLLANIISGIPQDITSLFTMFVSGKTPAKAILAAAVITAVIVATIAFVILLTDAVRKIPVMYAQKTAGRRTVQGQNSAIPLKVNTAGVIPVIFASSLLSIPQIILSVTGHSAGGAWAKILGVLNQGNWFDFSHPYYMAGLVLYVVLIVFFAYFYTSITFNPIEVADNLKKSGGQIPGIRAGKPTQEYLGRVLDGVIFIGAVGLTIAVLIPVFFGGVFHANVSFGGTSLIIIAGVILETLQQIDAKLVVGSYSSFLAS